MSSQLLEYIKLHKLSLEQDRENLYVKMDHYTGYQDSDEFKMMEIEDISLTGQIIALNHIIFHAPALDIVVPPMIG